MTALLAWVTGLSAKVWQVLAAVLLALLIVQTVRIEGLPIFGGGLADKVQACRKLDHAARQGAATAETVANARGEAREAKRAADAASVKGAQDDAEAQNPDAARAAAGPVSNAVADELRRQQVDRAR